MFRAFRRLSKWLSLVSLCAWAGVAWYIVSQQPVVLPSPDLPGNYTACVGTYAPDTKYDEVEAETRKRCLTYYALLGDREVPFYQRLYAHSILRVADDIMATYLERFPLQPGEVVNGTQMVERLGKGAALQFAANAVTEAHKPTPLGQIYQAACFLRTAHRAGSLYELETLPNACPRL